ncbi:MAG: AAA family ATPase, partial [Spongiibacteraceae bacterium]
MSNTMHFTHLVFQGPHKTPAKIEFGLGLNLIYGPSNTGKSSILDAIDFMFGRESALKELPEHDGYEEILLGIEFSKDGLYTFVRNINGGSFTCYDGTHFEVPEDQESLVLRPKNPTKKIESIRDFILERLDLAGKELKKNQKNEKVSLTLRNLAPLLMISERNIQRESSPFISEQYLNTTADKSRLRFLLTGVDDRKLIPEEKEREVISRRARLQLLSEFIEESEEQISSLGDGDDLRDEMEAQITKLGDSLDRERQVLSSTEAIYREALIKRNRQRSH